MKTSIIIPVYNETRTIEAVIRGVSGLEIEKEIIVVENGSTDDTAEIIARMTGDFPELNVVSNPTNIGKGHGIRIGLTRATGDIIAFQDADLELDSRDLVPMVFLIADDRADVVFGKRFGGHNRLKPSATVWANYFLSFLASLLLGRRVTDIETCYKVFRKELLQVDRLKANGFDIDPEVAFNLLSQPGIRYAELPIRYHPRGYKSGKKIRIRDGFKTILFMLSFRFAKNRSRGVSHARKQPE